MFEIDAHGALIDLLPAPSLGMDESFLQVSLIDPEGFHACIEKLDLFLADGSITHGTIGTPFPMQPSAGPLSSADVDRVVECKDEIYD